MWEKLNSLPKVTHLSNKAEIQAQSLYSYQKY